MSPSVCCMADVDALAGSGPPVRVPLPLPPRPPSSRPPTMTPCMHACDPGRPVSDATPAGQLRLPVRVSACAPASRGPARRDWPRSPVPAGRGRDDAGETQRRARAGGRTDWTADGQSVLCVVRHCSRHVHPYPYPYNGVCSDGDRATRRTSTCTVPSVSLRARAQHSTARGARPSLWLPRTHMHALFCFFNLQCPPSRLAAASCRAS